MSSGLNEIRVLILIKSTSVSTCCSGLLFSVVTLVIIYRGKRNGNSYDSISFFHSKLKFSFWPTAVGRQVFFNYDTNVRLCTQVAPVTATQTDLVWFFN